jgi:hypothetical protein
MVFEYDSSPVRNTVIGVAVIVLVSLLLPSTLLNLLGLSIAVGPAYWALIQWRRRGHGVRLTENMLMIDYPLTGRTRNIPYIDILGCAPTADQGLIVAYLRREKQPEPGNYPAISRVALAQAHPAAKIRRQLATGPRLKDVEGCLAALATHLEQNPPSLGEKFSEDALRSMARRKNVRNALLLLLAVLATPLYVIVIARVIAIFH